MEPIQLETSKNDPGLTAVLTKSGFPGTIDAAVWICEGVDPSLRSFGFEWVKKPTHQQIIARSAPTLELTRELDAKLREAAKIVIETADPPPFRGPFKEDIR